MWVRNQRVSPAGCCISSSTRLFSSTGIKMHLTPSNGFVVLLAAVYNSSSMGTYSEYLISHITDAFTHVVLGQVQVWIIKIMMTSLQVKWSVLSTRAQSNGIPELFMELSTHISGYKWLIWKKKIGIDPIWMEECVTGNREMATTDQIIKVRLQIWASFSKRRPGRSRVQQVQKIKLWFVIGHFSILA